MNQEIIKQKILALTGITADEYSMEIFNSALAFAYHYSRHDEWSVSVMTKTSSFWQFWQNQIALMDEIFLASIKDMPERPSKKELKQAWKEFHEADKVCAIPDLHREYSFMLERATVEDANIPHPDQHEKI